MTHTSSGTRVVAVLWFLAAGLAFVAVAIPFVRDREPNLTAAAGGLFCLIMGIVASRSQKPPSR